MHPLVTKSAFALFPTMPTNYNIPKNYLRKTISSKYQKYLSSECGSKNSIQGRYIYTYFQLTIFIVFVK